MNSERDNLTESPVAAQSPEAQASSDLEAGPPFTADLALARLKDRSLSSEIIVQFCGYLAVI